MISFNKVWEKAEIIVDVDTLVIANAEIMNYQSLNINKI